MPRIVMDTGPIVAYFHASDAYHEWAVAQFSSFDPPFMTCEPVLTEACFLLARARLRPSHVIEAVERGVLVIGLQLAEEAVPLREAMDRYANVPMSLADACVVRMAEASALSICTLDSDFMIYRTRQGRALELVSPSRHGLHEP